MGANILTTNMKNAGSSKTITYNVLGNSSAAVNEKLTFNGVGTATINVSTAINAHSVTLTLSSDTANTVNITGGAAGGTITHSGSGVVGIANVTVDATATASAVTLTSNAVGSTIKGSHSAVNTLTTGAGSNTFFGGSAADVFTITNNGATNGLTRISGHYNETNIGNSYVFKIAALAGAASDRPVVINDFNAGGINSSPVDKITFSKTNPPTGHKYGNGSSAAVGGDAAVVQNFTTADTILAATNILNYTGGVVADSNAMQTLIRGTAKLTFAGGNVTLATADSVLLTYYDGSSTHVALITQTVDTKSTTATADGAATVTDIALLAGVNNANIDSTDFNTFI
jgi:hypothetical protein